MHRRLQNDLVPPVLPQQPPVFVGDDQVPPQLQLFVRQPVQPFLLCRWRSLAVLIAKFQLDHPHGLFRIDAEEHRRLRHEVGPLDIQVLPRNDRRPDRHRQQFPRPDSRRLFQPLFLRRRQPLGAPDENVRKFIRQPPPLDHRIPLHLHHDQNRQPYHQRCPCPRRAPDPATELLPEQRRLQPHPARDQPAACGFANPNEQRRQ